MPLTTTYTFPCFKLRQQESDLQPGVPCYSKYHLDWLLSLIRDPRTTARYITVEPGEQLGYVPTPRPVGCIIASLLKSRPLNRQSCHGLKLMA